MTAIEISDDLAAVVKTRAAARGLTVDTWLKELVAESAAPESDQEENAKLEWLRAAAKESFGEIEKGDYTALDSSEEIATFLRQIHDGVNAELSAEQRAG